MQTQIAEIQGAVTSRLGFDRPIEAASTKPHAILSRILSVDLEVVALALGKFGVKLRSFAEAIDLEHPHAGRLFEEVIPDTETVENIFELLQLAEYARSQNLTRVISSLGSKVVSREKFCRNLLRTIDNPANNRWRIRLLKTRADRDKVRAQKRVQVIDLSSFFKKGDEIWVSQPSNFANFVRFNVSYQEEISFAERKAQRYLSLGCKGLYDHIQDSIDSFKSQVHENYFNFNRVTMTNAAIILAKFLGCKLVTSFSGPGEEESKSFRVSMPRSVFGSYCFEACSPSYPYMTSTGEPVSYRTTGSDAFDYEPRVYPLNSLWCIASERTRRVVDHLEAFPEAGGKAIFDNYAVLMPSPFYPRVSTEGKFAIRAPGGENWQYDTREQAMIGLDFLLLQNKVLPAVLLGEKDGKCFFISFWE